MIPNPRFDVRLLMSPASDTRNRTSRTTPLAAYGLQGRKVAVGNRRQGKRKDPLLNIDAIDNYERGD